MDIRKLRIFQEVAKQQSFTNAAKALYMTQPAISHAILELEKELQLPLFERFPKNVILTAAGEQFLYKVQQVLLLYDDLQTDISSLEKTSILRIGSSITIANDALCSILKAFQKMYPHMKLQVDVASVASIMDKLQEHSIDMAFLEGTIASDDLNRIPISSYRVRAVCSVDYVVQHPMQNLDDILSQPLLLREKGSAIRDIVDSAFVLKDRIALPAWTSTNSSVLLQAALDGFGVAFLPESMLHKKIQEGRLIVLDVENILLENTNHLVYKKQKYLSEPMHSLIDIASSYLKNK